MAFSFGVGIRFVLVSAVLAAGSFGAAQSCVSGAATSHTSLGGAANAVSVAALKIPAKAWNHLYRAVDAAHTGKDDDFAREVAKALEVAPEFAEAYILRASWEVSLRRNDAAVADVLAAQKLRPDILWAGVVLAGAYNGLRRYAEAVAALTASRGSEHESWQAKYEMARAVIGRRDAAEALRWSVAAFQAAPANCIDARLLVADAYILAHRWAEAVTELTAYLDSTFPQQHRREVLLVLEQTRRKVVAEDRSAIASTEPGLP